VILYSKSIQGGSHGHHDTVPQLQDDPKSRYCVSSLQVPCYSAHQPKEGHQGGKLQVIKSMAITETRVHFDTNKGAFVFMNGRLFRRHPNSDVWDTIHGVSSVDAAIVYLEQDVKIEHDAQWQAKRTSR